MASCVMAGYMRTSLGSTEASLKHVIFGAVSSDIMLYGLSGTMNDSTRTVGAGAVYANDRNLTSEITVTLFRYPPAAVSR
ncbi:MAG: hypothetical protein ABIF77_00830 [bacterium]